MPIPPIMDFRKLKTRRSAPTAPHIVDGAVCCCGDENSHYEKEENFYVSHEGAVLPLQPGQDTPLTAEDRLARTYESLTDAEISRLPESEQIGLAEWRDARAESIAIEFREKRPAYYRNDGNSVTLINHMAEKHMGTGCGDYEELDEVVQSLLQRGVFTVKNLCESFDELKRAGRMAPKPGTHRNLTADELRTVSAMCASCESEADAENAIETYLSYATGSPRTWREMACDPRFSAVVEKAMTFVFENTTPDYTPTPERRAFIHHYLAGRFASPALLSGAWEACKLAENSNNERPTLSEEATAAPATRQHDPEVWWMGGQPR